MAKATAKTAREANLELIDGVMERTVAEHEKALGAGGCSVLDPCPWCRVNDMLMEALKGVNG